MRLLTGFILDFVSAKKANYVIITLMMLHILTLHIAVQHWRLYMISSMVIMGCEGAYTSLQAVLIMQQFGLKRGPEVFAYVLSSQALSSLLAVVLVDTLKQFEGYEGMFTVSFFLLILALFANFALNNEVKVKYTDLYYKTN